MAFSDCLPLRRTQRLKKNTLPIGPSVDSSYLPPFCSECGRMSVLIGKYTVLTL